MSNLALIKERVKALYESDPHIHINVSIPRLKPALKNVSVVITAIYPNIFRIEEDSESERHSYTVQYTDILTKQIEILELNAVK